MKQKYRFSLWNKGRLEFDYETNDYTIPENFTKPTLKETITIYNGVDYLDYKVEFIQYFFNDKGEFIYIMVTGIRID